MERCPDLESAVRVRVACLPTLIMAHLVRFVNLSTSIDNMTTDGRRKHLPSMQKRLLETSRT